MGRDFPLEFSREALGAICRRYGVRRLSAFGSVLREDFLASSDVDLLVEFEPARTPGLAFFRLEEALAGLLGRRVDLSTKASLSPTSVTASSTKRETSMSRHDPPLPCGTCWTMPARASTWGGGGPGPTWTRTDCSNSL